MQKATEISQKTFLSSINEDFCRLIKKKKKNLHSAPLKQTVANKQPHETTELVKDITANTEAQLPSILSLQTDFRSKLL